MMMMMLRCTKNVFKSVGTPLFCGNNYWQETIITYSYVYNNAGIFLWCCIFNIDCGIDDTDTDTENAYQINNGLDDILYTI